MFVPQEKKCGESFAENRQKKKILETMEDARAILPRKQFERTVDQEHFGILTNKNDLLNNSE
jgi:hypothetical protein